MMGAAEFSVALRKNIYWINTFMVLWWLFFWFALGFFPVEREKFWSSSVRTVNFDVLPCVTCFS